MLTNDNNKTIILQDIKPNGKERKWHSYKLGSFALSQSYKRLGMDNRAIRVLNCGAWLEFDPLPDGKLKLKRAFLCGDNLCPACNAQRARKLAAQTSKIMDYIEEDNYRYIFVTLTQRNVKGEDLKEELDKINYAFNRFTKSAKFQNLSVGWMRTLEITHNWKEGTYHPHIHMLVAVKESYFDDWENYLSHDELKKMWTKYIGQEDETQVDIRRVKRDKERSEKGSITYKSAIAEITKYSAKSDNFIINMGDKEYFMNEYEILLESQEQCNEMTDEVINTLFNALYRKRKVTYGGIFKEVHKELNLKDPNSAELEEGEETSKEESSVGLVFRFDWKLKKYVLDIENSDPAKVAKWLIGGQFAAS